MVETARLKKPVRRISKGEPPSPTPAAPGNLRKPSSTEKVPIQFKVSAEVRREIKTYTIAHDYEDQSTLFVGCCCKNPVASREGLIVSLAHA
jgi:hypothetical protein